MFSAFVEYFRCPDEFVRFSSPSTSGGAQGFFRFGSATCFGRCEAATVQPIRSDQLPDSRELITYADNTVQLPFDPEEIFNNLRTERYISSDSSFTSSMIRRAYYALRSVLPVSMRKYPQRFHLRRRRDVSFPKWPIEDAVDLLSRELMSCLSEPTDARGVPFIWFWPDGFESCVAMTHDVEHEPGRAFCSELMNIDLSYGIRSSFQIVPEKRYEVTSAFLHSIRTRGFELNIHDLTHNGHLFHDRETFLRSAPKINSYAREWGARGFRAAAMYRNPSWMHELELSYDMSFPSAAHLEPQLGGCCTVMPYFLGNLVELPLTTTQDYTLLHILQESSIDLWTQEIAMLRERNALISFIVHPDYVISRRGRRFYLDLLEHLCSLREDGKMWFAQPGEVADWWRNRARMKIIREQGEFRIIGPHSHRARLAFARNRTNGLSFECEENNSVPVTVK